MKKKIPDHAERVFKGILFEVWQWQQEMFDGTFSTFEVVKRNTSVKVLPVTKDKKILVTFEEQPSKTAFIAIPGGQSEDGEDLFECAKRELLEETGYASDFIVEWFDRDIFGWQKLDWNSKFFIARHCTKVSQQSLDSGEKIKIKEVSFEEFIKITQEDNFSISTIKEMVAKVKNYPEKLEEFRKEIFGE